MRRFVIALALVATALAGSPFGVAAAQANSREILFSDHVDVIDPIVNCGSFFVVDHAVADITGTLYLDNAGNPYRFRLRIQGTDTLSSSAGGPSYSSPNVLTYTEDYRQDRAWKTGIAFKTTVPHFGQVFTDVGVVQFDSSGITAHGQHIDSPSDFNELCNAFA